MATWWKVKGAAYLNADYVQSLEVIEYPSPGDWVLRILAGATPHVIAGPFQTAAEAHKVASDLLNPVVTETL